MKKHIAIGFFSFVFSCSAFAQPGSTSWSALMQIEDSLKVPALDMIRAEEPADRFIADSMFTRMLVRALKTPHSFYYPFDSIITVSKLYAPDSTFRIFTWQLVVHENMVRQKGAIQMRTKDGSLKLFPLIDQSDDIENIEDTITSHKAWIGALYYKIILTQRGDQPVYTLLGFDENNFRSSRKYIEILQFKDGEPVFGDRIFTVPNNTLYPQTTARLVMEYKKDASARLTYDEDLSLIAKEHLISETNEPKKKYTLVGDGDYEGFKWMEDKWVYISKIFTQVTPENQLPMPNKLLNDDGSFDASKMPDMDGIPDTKEKNKKKKKP
ncbi:MAG: hypothetical protein KF880_06360 [Ferruginibacter sp.]|nr:hypothetical protein [Ferruginibacter sp.]